MDDETFLRHHQGLTVLIARRAWTLRPGGCALEYGDVLNETRLRLLALRAQYDPTRGKGFAGYALRYLPLHLARWMRRPEHRRAPCFSELGDPEADPMEEQLEDPAGQSAYRQAEDRALLAPVWQHLSPRQRQLLLLLAAGWTFREISAHFQRAPCWAEAQLRRIRVCLRRQGWRRTE